MSTELRDRLIAERLAARSGAEVCAAVAGVEWYNTRSEPCPDHRIPAPEDLVRRLTDAPPKALEVEGSPLDLPPARWTWEPGGPTEAPIMLCADLDPDSFTLTLRRGGEPVTIPRNGLAALKIALPLEQVHDAWCRLPEQGRPRHPLAPLVKWWQNTAPVPAEWDRRPHANLPASMARTRHVVPAPDDRPDRAGHLPFDALNTTNPTPPPDAARYEVGYLPTLEPWPSRLPTAMLAALTTGACRGRRGPVPPADRLLWECVLAVPPERRDHSARLTVTLADLSRMVWPNTKRYSVDRNYIPLLRALDEADRAAIRWRNAGGDGLVRMFTVPILPTLAAPDVRVGVVVTLPGGDRQGPQVDRELLRRLAATSARQHRAMLAAYCLFDTYGTVHGRLIAPTLPVVRRDPAGYVLDARGRVVLEHGAPTRRATHKLAVQTGDREPNPEADRYPWLEGADVILLCHPFVARTPEQRRKQRQHTVQTLEALRDRGALDFETRHATPRHGGRPELVAVRLLPSTAHIETHRARWAAQKHGR